MRDLVPHALPYAVWVALGAAAGGDAWADAARLVVAGALLVLFAARGAYPELRDRPRLRHGLAAVAAGVAVGALWVPLAQAVPSLGDTARTGLDPASAPTWRVAVRIAGMVLVVPLAEELLVRSALPRLVDARGGEGWRALPVGRFTGLSAAVSIAFFTLTHPEWLAALAAALLWTGLLAVARSFRALVLSHAVANAWLAGQVLVTGDSRWW